MENQALRELNRRHARAIDRYSSAESHLQELLAGHRHEMTHLRTLLKMSQEAERNTAQELKRVEAEMRRTEGDLKTLLVLSEDKALAEREELNRRLAVLNETLEQKDERIQVMPANSCIVECRVMQYPKLGGNHKDHGAGEISVQE